MKFTRDMMTEAYIEKHSDQLSEMINKMLYFENIQKEAINAPYFENLPEYEKRLLRYRARDTVSTFENYWQKVLASKGLMTGRNTVTLDIDEGYREEMIAEMQHTKEELQQVLTDNEEKERELKEEVQTELIFRRLYEVENSLPEPALDKAIGTQADYENLRELLETKSIKEKKDGIEQEWKGLIAKSDKILETEGSYAAELAFEFRNDKAETAPLDRKFRGEFFATARKDYVQLFRSLFDAGLDFAKMETELKRESCGHFSYLSGGGLHQICDIMFTRFKTYAEAPQGQEYVRKMKDILGKAKVFEGSPEKCTNFIMQNLMNRVGADIGGISPDRAYYGEVALNVSSVAAKCTRNLQVLSAIMQATEEQKRKLNPEFAVLLERYTQLVQWLSDL